MGTVLDQIGLVRSKSVTDSAGRLQQKGGETYLRDAGPLG